MDLGDGGGGVIPVKVSEGDGSGFGGHSWNGGSWNISPVDVQSPDRNVLGGGVGLSIMCNRYSV